MLSSGTQAADFIKVLYPTLQSAGLADHVKITCCDSEGWNNQKTMTSQLISAGVENQVGIITSHSYVTQPDVPISTSRKVCIPFACVDAHLLKTVLRCGRRNMLTSMAPGTQIGIAVMSWEKGSIGMSI